MIYLDNSATTLIKPKKVTERIIYALENYANPSRGGYPAAMDSLRKIYACREKVSTLFGLSNPARVAFTANITESLNICAQMLVKEGDVVITTIMEHNSVLRPLYKRKARLHITGLNENGSLDYDEIEKHLKNGAKTVFSTHASNLTGDLNEIGIIGGLCEKYGALFVLDSAQTAGVFDIDMQKQKIDVVCFTGHKSLYGPQGVGGLCVKEGVPVFPVNVGGSGFDSFSENHPSKMPEALEAGTPNTPGICGLSTGIDFINTKGIKNIREHEGLLMKKLYYGIKDIPGVKIYGVFEGERAPIVTFNIHVRDSGSVAAALWNKAEIAVRSGAHCAPLFHKYLKTDKQGAVRMSLSYFNTAAEIEAAINAVREISGE